MEMILGLIDSLKLNNSLFVQFVIFLVGFSFLYYVLFKPYNNAAEIRFERTTGSEENADKYDEEIELLNRKYGQKAKETNLAIKTVFVDYEEKTKKEIADLMMAAQSKYKEEKDSKEQEANAHYQKEKSKVPVLVEELKAQLKKVLAGA